jgi:hypothetical protein
MAKPKKGVIPPQLRPFVKGGGKKAAGSKKSSSKKGKGK